MSLPGQVRARSPGTASRQNQGFWPPILARKVEEEYQHEILYFDSLPLHKGEETEARGWEGLAWSWAKNPQS